MTSKPDTRLHIPKPCHEDWDAMTDASRGRHCASCDKTVVDVTRMAPPEAMRFLAQVRTSLPQGEHVCVRAHADRSGRLLAPSATRRLLTNGLAAVISMTIAGCHGDGPTVAQPGTQAQTTSTQQAAATTLTTTPSGTNPPTAIMGDVCVQPSPAIVKGEIEAVEPPVMGEPVIAPEAAPQPGQPIQGTVSTAPSVEEHVLMGKPSMDPPRAEVEPKP